MFVLYAKNEEQFVYQDILFLGLYSTIEHAKEQMYIYNSNLKLQKLTYIPDYKYFIFQTDINKKVILEEHEAVFTFYNDKIIINRTNNISQFDLELPNPNIGSISGIDVSFQTDEQIENPINIKKSPTCFFLHITYNKVIYTGLLFSAIYYVINNFKL